MRLVNCIGQPEGLQRPSRAYSSAGVKLVLGRGEHILSISTSTEVNGYVPHMLDPLRG